MPVKRILLEAMPKRTDLMDTSEWAHREMLRRLREMTPEERLNIAFDRITSGREIHREAMLGVAKQQNQYPR